MYILSSIWFFSYMFCDITIAIEGNDILPDLTRY